MSSSAAAAAAPRYMKRKIKSGQLEADFEERALVVHYEVEATVLGDFGQAMQTERKSHAKRIRLKQLNENTNVPMLAEEIVSKCKLIHPSKLQHVENLLYALQQREVAQKHRADSTRDMRKTARRKKREAEKRARQAETERLRKAELESASMDDLDDYLEKLYENEMDEKVKGTAMLLQLARHAGNLEALVQNESLMGALSRVLKEDYKKSMDLVINIMYIFFSFSNFSQMHPFLLNYQVGNWTMKVIDLEVKRHALRMQEMNKLAVVAQKQAAGEPCDPKDDPRKTSRKGTPVDLMRERKKTKMIMRKQEKLLFVCFHVLLNLAEDVQVERKMVKRKIVQYLAAMLDRTNAELLVLVVTFLKKLSIFQENKDDMAGNPSLLQNLCKFVPCSNDLLMQLVLKMLFNLSFDAGLRDQMVKNSLIPKLVDLLKRAPFRGIALRLLYHISMDDRCKSMFTYTEAIPIVMQLIVNFPQSLVAKELAALAINLSVNARNADLMVQGVGLKMLMERIVKNRDAMLMKVVRNISLWTLTNQFETAPVPVSVDEAGGSHDDGEDHAASDHALGNGHGQDHRSNAVEGKGPAQRMPGEARARSTLYRHRGLWAPYVRGMYKLLLNTESPELMLETLGSLANLTAQDMPRGVGFADLIINHGLVEFLHKHLVPGFAQDDIVLEAVMLIGMLCMDEDAARLIAGSPLPRLVHDLVCEKHDDAEIVLQCLFTLFRLLRHKDTAHELLYETQMVADVCDCLAHKNSRVRSAADEVLNLVIEHERSHNEPDDDPRDHRRMDRRGEESNSGFVMGELAQRIRKRRFELHNREWLELMRQEDLEEAEDAKHAQDYLEESGRSDRGPDLSPGDSSQDWGDRRNGGGGGGQQLDATGGSFEEADRW